MDNKLKSNLNGKPDNKKTLIIVLIVIIAAALIAGLSIWAWQSQKNEEAKKANDSRIKELEDQAAASKNKDSNSSSDSDKSEAVEVKPSASQVTINAILTASKTKDYAPLKQFFAEKMFVAVASTDTMGYDTPDDTVVDILNGYGQRAKQPWRFDIDADDIKKEHSYDEYINDGMYIGVSNESKGERTVMSFKIDDLGKIQSIFTGFEKVM